MASRATATPATATDAAVRAMTAPVNRERPMTSPAIELGNDGGRVELTGKTGKPGHWGLIWYHTRPDTGTPCSGCLSWDTADANHWTCVSEQPLTLSPSLNCNACGRHGFIENGRWRHA